MILRSLCLCLALSLPCIAGAQAVTARPVVIPPAHGHLLSGPQVDLPQALGGKVAVLVLGFSQGSRASVAAWGRGLAAQYGGSADVLYFEMPVLAAVPRLLRGIVLGKVKDGVPARAWAHCLPLTDHEAEWKQAAGFTDADAAYVLVVDSAGAVQAHLAGEATEASMATVKARVQHLQAHRAG